AIAVLTLAACATASPETTSSPESQATSPGACERVTVVVDFGPIDEPMLKACVDAGPATDFLVEAGVTTEGTVDYGDQVVCRVNNQPSPDEEVTIEGQAPFVESCETLNSAAYWALWVRNSPEEEWEYALEGVSTLELAEGQSLGLVYTPGTESIPPRD
ncbi:MAG: hypothetical protein Q8M65_09555, partial [Rhodoglobus sp.]|nr:hypothetical protein [Rhodoglobus sp.]